MPSFWGLNFREHFSLPISLSVFEGICLDVIMMTGVFWKICMQHLCWISHIVLLSSPGLYNHCKNSHKSARSGRVRPFHRGLTRLKDRVQVRHVTLQVVEGGCGLTRLSYDAQKLPWPRLCSCGWMSTLCPSGVKNFLQRVCLRWLVSCFLIPWRVLKSEVQQILCMTLTVAWTARRFTRLWTISSVGLWKYDVGWGRTSWK